MDGQRFARNQPRAELRQFSFSFVLEMPKEMLGHHELENRIAQKFEALVIEMIAMRLVSHARMRERFRQQERVAELVTDAVFERIHLERRLTPRGWLFQERRRTPSACARPGGRAALVPTEPPYFFWKIPIEVTRSRARCRTGSRTPAFRAAAAPLRRFHRLQLGILAGNKGGFVQMGPLNLRPQRASSPFPGLIERFHAYPRPAISTGTSGLRPPGKSGRPSGRTASPTATRSTFPLGSFRSEYSTARPAVGCPMISALS